MRHKLPSDKMLEQLPDDGQVTVIKFGVEVWNMVTHVFMYFSNKWIDFWSCM